MSTQAVSDYLKKLDENLNLRNALLAALKGKADQALTIVKAGAQQGFEFTADDYNHVVDSLHTTEEGELSDSDLESVAGGTSGSPSNFRNLSFQGGALVSGNLAERFRHSAAQI